MKDKIAKRWLLFCVITVWSFNSGSTELRILGHVLNETTKTFPLSPLNRTARKGHKIGTITAQDLSRPSQSMEYYLLDVKLISPNGHQHTPRPVGEIKNWKFIASNTGNNDCTKTTLTKYPEFRRQFCIDHKKGDIYTTEYFVQNPPASGLRYDFTIQYKAPPITYSAGVLPHSVLIVSVCDKMNNIFKTMTHNCRTDGAVSIPMKKIEFAASHYPLHMYFTSLRFSFNNLTSSSDVILSKGDKVVVGIDVPKVRIGPFSFVYVKPAIYTAVISPPRLLANISEMSNFRTHLFIKKASNVTIKWDPLPSSLMSATFLPLEDYCSVGGSCLNQTVDYVAEATKFRENCVLDNDYEFIGKYRYCNNNSAPVVDRPNGNIDWDDMQHKRLPSLLFSSYVKDDSLFLGYQLLTVTSKYPKPNRIIDTTSHANCITSLQNVRTPLAYFCLDYNSGSIYSTKALIDSIGADDQFTLKIRVDDVDRFPPRIVNISVQLTAKSACTATTAAFRKLNDSDCAKNFHKATMTMNKPGTPMFRLNLIDAIQSDVYYISGLWGTDSLKNESPERDGTYVGIELKNKGKKTRTKYYFVGKYSAFNPPLKYHPGDYLQLTSSYVSDDPTLYTMKTDNWLILLIKEYDYCSDTPNCINLYSSFDSEYQQNAKEIDTKCPNQDWYGFKAKFGFCSDNLRPELVKSVYALEKKAAAIIREVIPSSSSQMYMRDADKFEYHLLDVKSNIEFSNEELQLLAASDHKSCTNRAVSTGGSNDLFCINNATGKIYSTRKLTAVTLTVATYFNFTINVIEDTKYPMRSTLVNIRLNIKDKCSPASNTYNELESCVDYKHIAGSSIIDNSLIFYSSQQIQRILAIRFRISELNVNTDTIIYAELKSKASEGFVSTPTLTARAPVADKNEEIYQYLNVFLPRMDGGSVTAEFYKISEGGVPISINISKMEPLKFSLLTMVSYQCENRDCVDKYTRWKVEARNVSVTTGATDCIKDKISYGANFEKCIDPNPTFLSLPPTITPNITSGSKVTISNAIYNSPFQIKTAYWIKNGDVRINTIFEQTVILYGPGSNLPRFSVPDLTLNDVKLADQGFFQACLELDDGRRYYSKKVSLKLTDVAESRISMNITNVQWDKAYNDVNSLTYQQLEKTIEREVNIRINEYDMNSDRKVEILGFSGTQTVTANIKIFISNANTRTRLKYCELIRKAITNGKLGTLEIDNVFITTLDCCLKETVGNEEFKGVYTFETILTGTYTQKKCVYPKDSATTFIRHCITDIERGARWGLLDLADCQTKEESTQKLLELQVKVDEDNVEEISRNVSSIAKEENVNNIFDVELISDIITNVVNVNTSNSKVTANVLSTVNVLLQSEREVIVLSNEKSNSSSKLLDNLETLAEQQKPKEKGKLETFETEEISLAIIEPANDEPMTIYSSDKVDNKTQMSLILNGTDNLQGSISIPTELIKIAGGEQIHSYVIKSDVLFETETHNSQVLQNDTQKKNKSIVQSYVVSLAVSDKEVVNLTQPVRFNFKVKKIDIGNNETGKSVCKFWDPNFYVTASGTVGGWSEKGCKTIKVGEYNFTCECNHLTNFAIILDVSQSFSNPFALQLVSIIGCGISIVGLVLTIITNLVFKKIRQKVPSKILVNLSVSLLLTLVIFLAGAERVEPRIGCRIVAMLIQYFVLSTFFWMAVEGLNLYRNFVKVFSGGSKGKFLLKVTLFGWGGPLIITAATAGAQWNKMGPSGPDDGQFCVLQGTPFYFALLLPICIILVGNSVVLVLVLRGINGGSKIKNDSPKEESKKLAQARIAFACAALLGLTWVFGILAVDALQAAFQWLFCIFNSLQGFFIFIFYTARSVEARREWRILFGLEEIKDGSSYRSSRKVSSSTLSSSTKSKKSSVLEMMRRKMSSKNET